MTEILSLKEMEELWDDYLRLVCVLTLNNLVFWRPLTDTERELNFNLRTRAEINGGGITLLVNDAPPAGASCSATLSTQAALRLYRSVRSD